MKHTLILFLLLFVASCSGNSVVCDSINWHNNYNSIIIDTADYQCIVLLDTVEVKDTSFTEYFLSEGDTVSINVYSISRYDDGFTFIDSCIYIIGRWDTKNTGIVKYYFDRGGILDSIRVLTDTLSQFRSAARSPFDINVIHSETRIDSIITKTSVLSFFYWDKYLAGSYRILGRGLEDSISVCGHKKVDFLTKLFMNYHSFQFVYKNRNRVGVFYRQSSIREYFKSTENILWVMVH